VSTIVTLHLVRVFTAAQAATLLAWKFALRYKHSSREYLNLNWLTPMT
jgi:hypothetical protein